MSSIYANTFDDRNPFLMTGLSLIFHVKLFINDNIYYIDFFNRKSAYYKHS